VLRLIHLSWSAAPLLLLLTENPEKDFFSILLNYSSSVVYEMLKP